MKNSDRLTDLKLYLITDGKLFNTLCSMYVAIEAALRAGVKFIQLREKHLETRNLLDMASWMLELTKEYNAKLLINDRIDIALAVNADGVHIGQESLPVHTVRKIVGNKLLIGVSTHSLGEAVGAEKNGADFITLGPIYHTPSKLNYGNPIGVDILRRVKSKISIPVLPIGGIKLDKVKEVMDAGADGVALISAILTADNIMGTTKEFLRLIK
jgi:thiamine-phosphate pyrophosphorylase